MKLTKIFSGIGIVVCLLFCASAAHAQTLYGRTEVKYNETTRFMTATSSTEIDFSAMEFYQGYVNIKLTDGSGNTMASQTLADTDRDGFVEYSNTFAAGADYSEYMLKGTHRARMDIQDPAQNNHYVDYYYFGYNLDMGSEGGNAWRYVMFIGLGPRKNWTTPWLTIDGTIDANIALNMPQGVSRADWDGLNDEEKQFVIEHTDWAIDFMHQAQTATGEMLVRFAGQNQADGSASNAFRHAYWNALMGQWTSYANQTALAEEFATAHENYPRNPNDAREATFRNMDLVNNGVGRQIGINNPSASNQQLADLVMQALNNHQLTVICPSMCR
jgi:hypothetical protein